MLIQMSNVQADLHRGARRYTNAMPHRSPKVQARNVTGLYLGVVGENGPTHSTVPLKSRGRGMPSRRVQTPAEEKRYTTPVYYHLTYEQSDFDMNKTYPDYHNGTTTNNVPNFPFMPHPRFILVSAQKKVEMLRTKDDNRGFLGNPVKQHQGRGLTSTDDMARAYMYPQDSDQFWDITKRTERHFTATHNSGVQHLEYLNPDPDNTIDSYYPKAFDRPIEDVLIQEIQQAVERRKEMIGLIHCYNKICKGKSEALQSLLPNRPGHAWPPNVDGKTGFSIKSYRMPAHAQIDGHFHEVRSRPKTVAGVFGDRPHVPCSYFYKMYNPPKTAGTQRNPVYSGAGKLSHSITRERISNSHMTESPFKSRINLVETEELIPLSPRQPPTTPLTDTVNHRSGPDILLPTVHGVPSSLEQDDSVESVHNDSLEPPVIDIEQTSNSGEQDNSVVGAEPLMKIHENSLRRRSTLHNLLDEHAEIVKKLSTGNNSPNTETIDSM